MTRFTARLALAAAPALVLVLAGPATAQKQILQDRPVTMETLLDRIQIEDFITRYYYDLSVGKAKELAEYFTEDAVLDVDGVVAKGHAEIAKLYEGLTADDVMVFAGAEEAIFCLMSTSLQEGNHAVVTWPGYQSLYEVARSAGAKVAPPSRDSRSMILGDSTSPSSQATTTRPAAVTSCTCAGRERSPVERAWLANVRPPSSERAYQTPASPAFPVHQATCTRPSASSRIEGPAWGQPGKTHPSARGHTASAQVAPPSSERATTTSRTSPGRMARQETKSAPPEAAVTPVRQQGHAGRRSTGWFAAQVRPPSPDRLIHTPDFPSRASSQVLSSPPSGATVRAWKLWAPNSPNRPASFTVTGADQDRPPSSDRTNRSALTGKRWPGTSFPTAYCR